MFEEVKLLDKTEAHARHSDILYIYIYMERSRNENIRRIKKDISLANNRKEWRKLVDEAKNLLGFQEPQRVSE
jgi:hypothetical protein